MNPVPCCFCERLPVHYGQENVHLLDCPCRPHELEPALSYEDAVDVWNATNKETEGVEAV